MTNGSSKASNADRVDASETSQASETDTAKTEQEASSLPTKEKPKPPVM